MNDEGQAKEIFQRALEKPPAERGAYLEAACTDPALRHRVDALLAAYDDLDDFLAEPTGGAGAPPEGPGTTIGPYKLLQEIGAGGFGVVYMAEQSAPVRRKVALKIIKLGMDTKQVIARFEAERQALALMDHGNIAKVLDAGATDAGRPYFVMELVKGIPITAYCDQAQLDTRARLALFQQVCHAVQHAHNKGIIHRDLKPSNVLVTLHDGTPVPKVIDFGIAKATDRRLTDKTLFTEFRQWIGTPDYMAPEQAELSGLDVDTRADVYSLGVLLYELLTGTKPFDMKTLLEKGYEEIVRTIREVDPPRPSTRLSTMGDQLTALAKKRHTDAGLLGKVVRGDLDWIVMKALEKDRSRRYETADGFATDIQHYLDDEPVAAMPPTAGYRARKYLRRHRLGVTAATIVLVTLVAGGGLAYAGMREAEREERAARDARVRSIAAHDAALAAGAREADQRERARRGTEEAESEKARAEAVLGFVNGMLASANPEQPREPDYTVRQLLEEFDRSLGARLQGQPDVEATLRATMGTAFLGLGLFDKAEPHLKAALELRRGTHGEQSPEFAASLSDWAALLAARGRYREAVAHEERALAIARRTESLLRQARYLGALARYDEGLELLDAAEAAGAERSAVLAERGRLLQDYARAEEALREALRCPPPAADRPAILRDLVGILRVRGRYEEEEKLAREAIDLARRVYGDRHPEVAHGLGELASAFEAQGRYEAAEKLARESLAMLVATLGEEHPLVADGENVLGIVLWRRGDYREAEACCRRALATDGRALGPRHPTTATMMNNLAVLLIDAGKPAEAQALLVEALDIAREVFGERHPVIAKCLHNQARLRGAFGDCEEAIRLDRQAVAMMDAILGAGHPESAEIRGTLGALLEQSSDYEAADQTLSEALETLRTTLGERHPTTLTYLASVGWLRGEQGDLGAAGTIYGEVLEAYRATLGDRHPRVAGALAGMAQVAREAGEMDEAERYARQAVELMSKDEGSPLYLARAWQQLGWAKQGKGDYDSALQCHQKALDLLRRMFGDAHPEIASSLGTIGGLLAYQGDPEGAIRYLDESLEMKRSFFGDKGRPMFQALNNYGWICLKSGDLERAEELLGRAEATWKGLGLSRHGPFANCLMNLADLAEQKGDFERAEERLREGVSLAREAYGDQHPATAGLQHRLGCFLSQHGRSEEAEPLLDAALATLRAKLGESHPDVLDAMLALASVRQGLGRPGDAEPLARSALQHLGTDSERRVTALGRLGVIVMDLQRPDEAEPLVREAVATRRRLYGDDHPLVADALRILGWTLERAQRLDGAEQCFREAFAIDHPHGSDESAGEDVRSLWRVLQARGDLAGLERFCREVLASYDDTDERYVPILAVMGLAVALQAKGDFAGEVPLQRRLLAYRRGKVGDTHPGTLNTILALAAALRGAGRYDEAERELQPLLAVDEFRHPALALLSQIQLARDEAEQAETTLRECLAIRQEKLPGHWLTYNAMSLLGEALTRQGKYAEAEPLLLEGFEKMEPPPESAHRKREARERIVQLYEAWDKPAKAAEWRR